MTINEVKTVFDHILNSGHVAGEFTAQRLEVNSRWLAGRDSKGRAVFLLEGAISADRSRQAGSLQIDLGRDLIAYVNGEETRLSNCLILTLNQKDSELELYFSEICLAFGEQLKSARTKESVLEQVTLLCSLFGFSSATRESVKGLWGELVFASWFRDPNDAIAAWPDRSNARFDFESRFARWDIKTTEGTQRKHYFSLNQLAIEDAWVVSIVITESPAGQTLNEVVSNLRVRLSPTNQFKLDLRTAGFATHALAHELRFRVLEESLQPKLYKSVDLPRPYIQEKEGELITSVTFALTIPEYLESLKVFDATYDSLSQTAELALLGM